MSEVKKETIVSEELQYHGIVTDVYNVRYEGLDFTAEVYKHPGAVAIAATLDDEHFFVVKQFRFGANQLTIEFPAGKLEKGEEIAVCAIRELEEETGYHANNLVYLGKFYSSPAFLDEMLYIYYASDLTYIGQNFDPDENLELLSLSLNELEDLCLNAPFNDAKTLAMLFMLKNYLAKK